MTDALSAITKPSLIIPAETGIVPKCQAQARQRWVDAREKDLLEVPYFHVVFTLPHELNRLCQRNPALLYGLLFSTSAAALLELAANPKRLGAQIGFISILHTWGQNLSLHPHVHCVVPGGGLTADRKQWVAGKALIFSAGQGSQPRFLRQVRGGVAADV